MRRPESLPQCSRYKRLHSSIARPACESGRGLFPLPTSLRSAHPSRDRRSKACRRRCWHTAKNGGFSRSHKATEKRTPGSLPFCPARSFLFDLGSLRGLCGCQGPETKNLRPSAKSADSSFSDSLGIDLVRAIAPLHLPSANGAPPRDPFQNKSAKRKKRSPQISQIHADFFRSLYTDYGEVPFPSPANSATSLSSKPGCQICG